MDLTHAGNTVIPAIKVLRSQGFSVQLDATKGRCTAERGENRFTADDPVAVLGLVTLYQVLGDRWQLPDSELMDLGREYGLL